jgi:hypothetical protein
MKTWLEFLCLVKFFIWIVFRGYLSCYDSQVRLHAPFSRMCVLSRHHRFLVVGFFMALVMGIMLRAFDWEYSHALMDLKSDE